MRGDGGGPGFLLKINNKMGREKREFDGGLILFINQCLCRWLYMYIDPSDDRCSLYKKKRRKTGFNHVLTKHHQYLPYFLVPLPRQV